MQQTMTYSESRYKEILLKTMKAFIAFCKEHDIEYMAAYGTILGTIRHKGLIPWDDDIDVFMTRENYEKFLQFKKDVFKTGYEIIDKNDKGYYLPFAKFCDANSTIWEKKELPFVMGVFIDVFPLDHATEANNLSEVLKKKYKAKFDKLFFALKKYDFDDVSLLKSPKAFFMTIVKKVLQVLVGNPDKIKKSVDKIENQIKEVQGNYYMYYRSYDTYDRSMFLAEWFKECIDLPFEDFYIRVPKGYDAYLKKCYGDYMTPPPKEKQISQHYHYYVNLDKRQSVDEIRKIHNAK